jgi:enoyl-CoA hydratase/3-hydroxyacyl-CoA dehydrogenase
MDVDDISTVAVLGAGSMGHGIAEVAALAGYDVRLRDIDEELVRDGYDQIEWSLNKLAEKQQISEADAEAALGRVDPIVDIEAAVDDVDVVIEAVPEKMAIKREVYADLEAYAPDEAIFATNTSSLSITELSEATERPGQFCGMHFFNPPVRMPLVEVVAGAHTDEATLETIAALAERMDKTPVRVHKDAPGFVVNRVLVPLMNEAAWLVHEGEATVAEVDSTAKFGVGLPMGSFELADQVGIDVGYHVLEYMHETLGDAYEPCPLLAEKVEADELGKKTGRGFYDYEGEGADVPHDAVREDVQERLLAVMANEVAALVDGDVADPEAIDRAVELGAGFPEGPAAMADAAGLATLVDRLERLHEATGAARHEPREYLRTLAADGGSFHDADGDGDGDGAGEGSDGDAGDAYDYDAVRVEFEADGRVGHVILDRPHRLNTITMELLDEFGDAVARLTADESVRAILVTGEGDRAFSAGADIQASASAFGDNLEGTELSRRGQEVYGRLEEADVPVVIGVDGYCLGGGMELSLAGDLRVASRRSEFGQPEHNLGLLPGWGGTQRLQRIVGVGRAKEIIFTADRYEAETMADYGLVNEVTDNDDLLDRAIELATEMANGPPVAQRLTKRAMHRGWGDMEAGLEIEAQGFGHLFATDDLAEGATAFMGDRDPEFEGK